MKELVKLFNNGDVAKVDLHVDRRGTKVAKVTSTDGTLRTKRVTPGGAVLEGRVQAPVYSSKKERRRLARELVDNGCTQTEVANVLRVSQGTVSKDLKKIANE